MHKIKRSQFANRQHSSPKTDHNLFVSDFVLFAVDNKFKRLKHQKVKFIIQNINRQLKTPGEKPGAFKKEKIRRKH